MDWMVHVLLTSLTLNFVFLMVGIIWAVLTSPLPGEARWRSLEWDIDVTTYTHIVCAELYLARPGRPRKRLAFGTAAVGGREGLSIPQALSKAKAEALKSVKAYIQAGIY